MTEFYVMRVLGMNQRDFDEPTWLASYDVDWQDGLGRADFTTDITKAKRFVSAAALILAWRTTSTVAPIRADGKPNRPLTALSVLTEKYQPTKERQYEHHTD